ncbi:MAG: UMP kinase [Bacteroidales bacterium]|nr:UMP kinase [Bacteroidales bacterium]
MTLKRILLKLSGEALGGPDGAGLDQDVINNFAEEIAAATKKGVQIAIVIGGGNIFRGAQGAKLGFDRVRGDQMGMLATVINSIALSLGIKDQGVDAEVFTSTPMRPMAKYYMRDEVLDYMNRGGVAIIAGGTGNPFFTTDSAAALRACEIGADALLKGTKVDGVYNCDPVKNPDAVKYQELTFERALDENLRIMDQTAFTLCSENNMNIIVYDSTTKGNLIKLLDGENVGTTIHN